MKNLLAVPLFAVLVMLSACTTVENPPSPDWDISNDFRFEASTKLATSFWQDGDTELALETIEYGNLLLESINTGELSTPYMVDEYVDTLIAESNFQPSVKQSLGLLVDGLESQYLKRVNLGQLDPGATASVATIIRWVIEASEDTIRFGSPQTYGLPMDDRAELGEKEAGMLAQFLAALTFQWIKSWDEDDKLMAPQMGSEESLNFQAPTWAVWKYGEHWSDPLWGFTSFFSGCDSYASFRGYHSYGLDEEEQVAYGEWKARSENWVDKWGDGLRDAALLAQSQN